MCFRLPDRPYFFRADFPTLTFFSANIVKTGNSVHFWYWFSIKICSKCVSFPYMKYPLVSACRICMCTREQRQIILRACVKCITNKGTVSKKKKKSRPTDPNSFQSVTGNTHIFFFPYYYHYTCINNKCNTSLLKHILWGL